MSSRAAIETQMKVVAKEQNRRLARLHDDLLLVDSGFDSLCFAILVVRLEDELGVDPFLENDGAEFPKTFKEFVEFYDSALV
jgi:acyl carrier protein